MSLRRMMMRVAPGVLVLAVLGALQLDGAARWASFTASAEVNGLVNAGFEDGTLDGAPANWSVTSVADVAVVVDTEGPSEFASYAERNVTVEPNEGALSLRLGSPKMVAQTQNRGANAVSQTFASGDDSLTFAFRAFSWEHRGSDSFSFNLVDPSAPGSFEVSDVATDEPLVVTMPDGSTQACAQTPCTFSIDVGQSGNFLDTDWTEVRVSGLPGDGRNLVLTYSIVPTQSESHATWVYFDAFGAPNTPTPTSTATETPTPTPTPGPTNTDPVARFTFAPGSALESDFVQFTDQSYDPDAGDSIVSWLWTFSGPNISEATSDQQNPIFSFPDDGTFTVTLTVTDTFGASNTITSGEEATDGTLVPAASIGNAGMLVSVLDLEVKAGEPAQLLARFLDPGWLDAHDATWTVDGQSIAGDVLEENQPALSSGVIMGIFPTSAPGVINGSLEVSDDGGETVNVAFTITVVDDAFDRREANDTVATAPVLPGGAVYLSDLNSPADVDLFEAVLSSGAPLPPGSELLVTLSGLPADYDVVVLSNSPTDVATAPFLSSPFLSSPFLSSPFLSSPFLSSPFLSSPFLSSPFLSSPFLSSPFLSSPFLSSPFLSSPFLSSPFLSSSLTFDQFPLSQIGFAAPSGTELYGSDVSLVELGLGSLVDSDLQVVGHSANRGVADEKVLVRTDLPGTRLYVAVVGHNGSYASAPYSLGIETSRPLDLQAFLGDNCTGSLVVSSGFATSQTTMLYDHPGTNLTLMVTQRERMMALYGLDDAGWDAMLADLIALAQHANVAADIISVPSTLFDAWDTDPCNVDAANAVAGDIRDIALPLLQADPNKQYVVIAGNDDVIPHRRVPDETVIGNESLYGVDAFLLPGSPLSSSINLGMSLTDDYYVDADPAPWQGRELYVPDWSLGRLVETPEEIREAAQAFVASDGQLVLDSALVTGYDFFADGSQQTADALATSGTVDTVINDTWTADDLRCQFLGALAGPECAVHDVNAINAHFTHYAGLSASGFNNQNFADFITSAELAALGGGDPSLAGTLTFTIGCHAGLSVPDRAGIPPEAGLTIDPRLDFAQAMARQRAVYVANTGFGLGDSIGVAGNEELMIIFAQELREGGPAGQALADAKREYLLRQAALSVYVEKSSITTTLWGLPQYSTNASSATGLTAASDVQAQAVPASANITLEDGASTTVVSPVLTTVNTTHGAYIAADGGYQSTAGRAIQPRVLVDLPEDAANGPVHGIVVRGGTYEDTEPFDPVISRPQQDWDVNAVEPQVCLDAYWPSVFSLVNSLSSPGGLLQKAVVIPAQFRCTSGDAATATGLERVYDNLTLAVKRSTSDDFEAPALASGGLAIADNEGSIRVTIDATDDSGVAEIVAYVLKDGTLIVAETGPLTGEGPFVLDIPVDVTSSDRLVVQIVDGAGNVTTLTGKGANLRVVRVDAGPDQSVNVADPVTMTATIQDFDELIADPIDVSYVWDFGDDTFDGGLLAIDGVPQAFVTIDEAGNATFQVQHLYASGSSGTVTATLRVLDGDGGLGVDSANNELGDGDAVPSEVDNCPGDFNPDQLNTDGEPIRLPKPSPVYDDATNPAADLLGDACDGDADGDGLHAEDELELLLDPLNWDSDGDRTNDGTEVRCGSDPLLAPSNLTGTDTDTDGLPDACEALYGTNPNDRDSDDDGSLDGPEVRHWTTNPLSSDTDGDGCADALEMGSVNGDLRMTSIDMSQLAVYFGPLLPAFRSFDMNGDGSMNSSDLMLAAQSFGRCD